ncbi:MAG: LBF_2804 family protein [Flavobacteriales bacterium]
MIFLDKISEWLFDSFQGEIKGDITIDEKEIQQLNRLQVITLGLAAFIGALFILLYYLPVYLYEGFFNSFVIEVSFLGFEFSFFWLKQLDSFLLTFWELYVLGLLSVYAIQRMGFILDFPSKEIRGFELHRQNLKLISLQKKQKRELELGLNPYYGMSKFYLYIMLVFAQLQAVLSNYILKFILQRFGSRYLLKIFIDLAAMPVYAFWNAWATHRLLLRAKYYIFSVQLTEAITQKISENKEDALLKSELDKLLSFIVVLKRDFSEINHYFSARMLEAIGAEITTSEPRFELKNHAENTEMNQLVLLFATGIILDGTISARERKYIKSALRQLEHPPLILLEIEDYLEAYRKGLAVAFLTEKGYL